MPVKVLYFITELNIGGAEKILTQLLTQINRSRFDPIIACLYGGDSPVADEIRALKLPVVDLGMTAKWRFDAFWRLFRLLQQERPMILHAWLFHANLSGRILGWFARIPLIICSELTMAMESEWRYRLNRWTIRFVDRVTANSNQVRDFSITHIGLPANKLVTIHNGVTIGAKSLASGQTARLALNLPQNENIIGAVSRLDPVKGVDNLLRAFALIDNAHLVIIGDGPERTSLEMLASELALTDRVHWAGYRTNIPALLPALDIFVQPSLHEGLPNAVLEAMAAGLPVVATAVGGTPEAVLDGETGILVPAGDSAALAEAIIRLLGDLDLRHRLGQAGFERVCQHFTVQQMASRTEALYNELIAEKLESKLIGQLK